MGEKLYKENRAMRMVYDKMDDLTKSLNEMLHYDHEEFWRVAAYDQGNKDGKVEGMKVGRSEGRKEEKMEIARKMLEMDLTLEQINEATGLSIEEIKELEQEIV